MKIKIKWEVSKAPSGKYRSFSKRTWPNASYEDGSACATIYCDEKYDPSLIKTGNHQELTLRVATWLKESERNGRAAFEWRQLKMKFKSLKEAKAALLPFLRNHPEYMPEEYRTPYVITCKHCLKDVNKEEVGRIFGKDLVEKGFCSAKCYTDHIISGASILQENITETLVGCNEMRIVE